MVLILTSEKDLTADFLIVELINRQLPYFRLNAEELTKAQFTFGIDQRGVQREVSNGPVRLDLSKVTSVWYRRAVYPSSISSMTPGERAFVAGELRHLAMGLVLNPAAVWVNPIDKVSVAEHKLYQLQIARRLGFRVPRTLVSSDQIKLREFSAANESGTICKPIFHGLFFDEECAYSVYTRRVTPDSFNRDDMMSCPVLLQEEVTRRADVRATFIGRKCFVADITGNPGLIDWRDPDVAASFSASSLNEETETMCREMLTELGLNYGAFDFVRTPEDDLVFLEVNPTGEWAWLEERLGFPMREAFIQLFFDGVE
jgi:hypothetical protein